VSQGAHPPEIEARQQLVTGLLRWMLSLESDAAWTERVVTVQPTASGQVRYELVERREDGEHRESDLLSDSVAEAVRALQQFMYSPTGVTWLTAELSVTAAGQGDARFNYSDEPRLPGHGRGVGRHVGRGGRSSPPDLLPASRSRPRLDAARGVNPSRSAGESDALDLAARLRAEHGLDGP